MSAAATSHNVSFPESMSGDLATLDPGMFRRVANIAERVAGLSIPDAKRSMVQSRLNRRLKATGRSGFSAYLDFVESKQGSEELRHMISALTTNVSHFFRENHHFELFNQQILPDLLDRAKRGERVRIWSAGCSTGQEPYSIAMALLTAEPAIAKHDVKILATDIDHNVLSVAHRAIYDQRLLEGIPAESAHAFLDDGPEPGQRQIRQKVRNLVVFRHLNLIEPWPMQGQFQTIFCRNVLIYFSEATQKLLWPRLHDALASGGWLFLGHSERIQKPEEEGFSSVGVTSYRRRDGSVSIQKTRKA